MSALPEPLSLLRQAQQALHTLDAATLARHYAAATLSPCEVLEAVLARMVGGRR